MEDHLEHYLKNTRVSKSAIQSRLIHPFTNLKYPSRSAFLLLRKYANDFFSSGAEPRFIALAGLRGVGKTTLMWHTAEYIYNNHQTNIFFFNVNILKSIGISLYQVLEEFQRQILKKRFVEATEPITLLFDEVHDDENWANTLKILYEDARSAFILCTGSSALHLNQTVDLARRWRIEKIYPFKFNEFISAKTHPEHKGKMIPPEKDLSKFLKEALFYAETANESFKKIQDLKTKVDNYFLKIESNSSYNLRELIQGFISYQNIPSFLFYKDKYTITDSILDLLKRVILEDIQKLKPSYIEHVKIERLLLRLAASDELNTEKLSQILGLRQNEINDIIKILADAEILNILFPYGGIDARVVKNKKAFFMSPSLRRALLSTLFGKDLPEHYRGKLLEDIVVLYLRRILVEGILSFVSGEDQVNPDFVIETRDTPILLEVGTKKSSSRQVTKSKIKCRYGILVSEGISEPNLIENAIKLPLRWFLLL
ncbi:hypothetical protein JCM31826_12070 [Thermaurantimonas aggregans]|uniref:Uncharacterized protein n=2 Tax=Thermaurantimonas aggregans TaxID=2173829 RepID=A0A401XL06_9FLAO|nr:AAA family ATPase [Thermaurantimonas aggregans]GCD77725.1 hypothetical protein JCM31826_12070 [Thermaurantimonas aggregans]